MGIISWIIVGGIAGWLAAKVMGSRYTLVTNIVIGIIGGFVGGVVLSQLGMGGDVNGLNISSIFTAFVGAVLFIWLARFIKTL
jgi:uncharacterized membrane protein YeaQ/YmgE (transglycosylase-associated protein family)